MVQAAPGPTVFQTLLDERAKVPGDVRQMEALVRRLMDAGQYALARDVCIDIVALQPLHAIGRLTLVRAQISLTPPIERKAQWLNRERAIRQTLDECELDENVWLEASAAFERLGDIRAAINAINMAVAAGADPAAATIRTAYLYYFVQKKRCAVTTIKALLLRSDLKLSDVRISIDLALKLRKPAIALAFARKQAELAPDSLQHRVTLALALARASKAREALRLLQSWTAEILTTMPPLTLLEAATVFKVARQPKEELAVLVKAAERFPANQGIAEALKSATWASRTARHASELGKS